MQLSDIRTETLNHGFDTGLFSSSRLNQYINDGYLLACARVNWYGEEASNDFSTVNGTINYAWPTDVGRIRHVYDTSRDVRLLPVSLREIDNSGLPGSGPPQYYALDGSNFHIWPTPDGVYPIEVRYWKQPALLSNDDDEPIIPAKWHHLLWRYACAQCYASEDDLGMSAQWEASFEKYLAEFAADVKFPDTDTPDVARSFWDQERGITQKGWSLWGWL